MSNVDETQPLRNISRKKEQKLKKLRAKLQQSTSIEKTIGYSSKISAMRSPEAESSSKKMKHKREKMTNGSDNNKVLQPQQTSAGSLRVSGTGKKRKLSVSALIVESNKRLKSRTQENGAVVQDAIKRLNTKGQKNKKKKLKDPSVEFLQNPLQAPLVKEAKRFFASLGCPFRVHLGPTRGWRTLAKLSVRGTPPVIGLFAPGTHKVLPMADSVAHHPAINEVLCLHACVCLLASTPPHVEVAPMSRRFAWYLACVPRLGYLAMTA
jgi:hypothetical protein